MRFPSRRPIAAAAGAFVAELEAGHADGQVSEQAGQNLFNQLQQLLFNTPRQNATQVEQQYAQLLEQFDQFRSIVRGWGTNDDGALAPAAAP